MVKYPDKERGSPHIWFFVALLTGMEMAQKAEELIPPGEDVRKTVESQMPHELNAWVKACKYLPNFDRHGQPPKSRIVFAVKGSCTCHTGRRTIAQKEVQTQDLIQARPSTMQSNSAAGRSSAWKHRETADRCNPGQRKKKERK